MQSGYTTNLDTAKQNAQEQLDRTFQFRKKQQDEIAQLFADMRAQLAPHTKAETLLCGIYQDLDKSMTDFETTLFAESQLALEGNKEPLCTAQKLKNCMNDALNVHKPTEEKVRSIQDFQNHSRGSNMSMTGKRIAGFIVGAIIGALVVVPIAIITGPVAPIFAVLMSFGGVAFSGFLWSTSPKQNPNENRGKNVSDNLRVLIKERNKLFASGGVKSATKLVDEKTPLLKPG